MPSFGSGVVSPSVIETSGEPPSTSISGSGAQAASTSACVSQPVVLLLMVAVPPLSKKAQTLRTSHSDKIPLSSMVKALMEVMFSSPFRLLTKGLSNIFRSPLREVKVPKGERLLTTALPLISKLPEMVVMPSRPVSTVRSSLFFSRNQVPTEATFSNPPRSSSFGLSKMVREVAMAVSPFSPLRLVSFPLPSIRRLVPSDVRLLRAVMFVSSGSPTILRPVPIVCREPSPVRLVRAGLLPKMANSPIMTAPLTVTRLSSPVREVSPAFS